MCTSSTNGSAMLSSSWPSSSIQAVANQVFCWSFGYIPHVCRNGQWWPLRNAAQIRWLMKSLCIHNHTQPGWEHPTSYNCNPCSNNSELSVLDEHCQAFAWVVRLGQNRVSHTSWLNPDPGGYDYGVSDPHQHCHEAQIRVLNGFMRQPNITTLMFHWMLESCEDHSIRLAKNGDTLQSDEPSILEC